MLFSEWPRERGCVDSSDILSKGNRNRRCGHQHKGRGRGEGVRGRGHGWGKSEGIGGVGMVKSVVESIKGVGGMDKGRAINEGIVSK